MTLKNGLFALLLTATSLCAVAEPVSIESIVDAPQYSATINGFFERPEGEGPFPAVVLMHGCSGLTRTALKGLEGHAGFLRDQGFATLILDSFSARDKTGGVVCTSNAELQAAWYYRQFDAFHGLEFLQSQPAVDGGNIYLIGQSQGGSVALGASIGAGPEQFPSKPRFRAIVAYYPWCGALPVWPAEIASPLLVLGAGRDDWVAPDYCVNARERVRGAPYDVVVYQDAHHGFDLPIGEIKYAGHTLVGSAAARADSRQQILRWFARHRK